MGYTIKPYLQPTAKKDGTCKLSIRVVYNRLLAYAPTEFSILPEQLKNNEVVNHPHKTKMNFMLRTRIVEIEGELLDLIKKPDITLEDVKRVVRGEKAVQDKFTDFIQSYIDEMKGGKRSKATIQVYKCLMDELVQYDPNLYFYKISISWLNKYEQHQRSLWEINTVNKKMKNIKGFLRRASEKGLIKLERFLAYKVPVYDQSIPVYLEEDEIGKFKAICDVIQKPMMKMSGYYFLLSCYAGYRISDFKKFNYESMVSNGKILLKAKKNKRILSIPIHTRLAEILSYCRDNPFSISEQNARDYVKDIAKLVGITRKIKVHTARHSFAMLLMDKGFDLEEVAELLGVTFKTASVYARISNKRLETKILDRLG
jgi:site-specific recombinase XerD